jgi:hypothetical protein
VPYEVDFDSALFTIDGKGGWTFAPVPEHAAPSRTEAWGRAPVVATVDGQSWNTSVWREQSGRTLLAVPRLIRGGKGAGDVVRVRLRYDAR